ncbi:MAG: hypothetical protein JXR31_10825, partial [Prolixibacteraceae bacterium]|nr:hypothetical protein [Prolixibacteraceae bacterium]
MEKYFEFLIKASLGIILFYSLYWVFLRKETYYQTNRFFLIFTLLLAVILPLFPYHYTVFVESETTGGVFEAIGNSFKKAQPDIIASAGVSKLTFIEIATVIYLTGISIFIFRLLIQTAILIRLILKYRIKSLEGIRIVENH